MGRFDRIIALIAVLFFIIVFVYCIGDNNSQNTFRLKEFEDTMKNIGYEFEIQDAQQDFLPTTRKRMIFNHIALDIYLFSSDDNMECEANNIDSGGCGYDNGFKAVNVCWVSFPHFYKKGNLIVQYIGEDEKIMSDLTDIFGEQFAGNAS
jgi:hypothetical protein